MKKNMLDCCSVSTCKDKQPIKKCACPISGHLHHLVAKKTMFQHLKQVWLWKNTDTAYYFCRDTDCDVAYFNQAGDVILQSALREPLGIKQTTNNGLICYCFGVTKSQVSNPDIKHFVLEQTKMKQCACDLRNPSGKCCLKDFPS